MENFIHFKSDCPSLISINGIQLGYTQKATDTISIKTDESILVATINPIEEASSSHLSFSAKVFFQNKKLLTDNPNTQIYNFGNNNFEIIFTPQSIQTGLCNIPTTSKKLGEKLYAEYFDFSIPKLSLKQDNLLYEFYIEHKLKEIKIESYEFENSIFVILFGKLYNNLHFLMIICNFFCNLKIVANEINFDENKIEAITYLNDVAEQAFVEQYKISKNGFKKVDDFLIYKNKKPYIEQNPNLIPWAFMESVNYENYKLCKQYLSSELSTSLDENHIKTFFGNYQKIDWDKYGDGPQTICVFNEKSEKCKKFKFEIDKNKIVNIIQLD